MTTPDPIPGSGPTPAPDDATSTFDADAARAATPSAAPAPWTPDDAAPWPAGAPAMPPGTPPPVPPLGAAPPAGAYPPAASVPPPGYAPAPGSVPPPGYAPAPGYAPGPSWAPAGAPTRRSTPAGLVGGVILVIIGGALLLQRVVDLSLGGVTWPLWIVVPGVAMLVGSFFIPPRDGVGLAIAGTIVSTVGLILWVQDAYDLYATWAYAWALVAPTGPGIGMLLYGLVYRDGKLIGDGFRTTLVGLGLFLGFALFFEGVIGLSGRPIANLDQVAPYGIIGLGVLLVILSFLGSGRHTEAPHPR